MDLTDKSGWNRLEGCNSNKTNRVEQKSRVTTCHLPNQCQMGMICRHHRRGRFYRRIWKKRGWQLYKFWQRDFPMWGGKKCWVSLWNFRYACLSVFVCWLVSHSYACLSLLHSTEKNPQTLKIKKFIDSWGWTVSSFLCLFKKKSELEDENLPTTNSYPDNYRIRQQECTFSNRD